MCCPVPGVDQVRRRVACLVGVEVQGDRGGGVAVDLDLTDALDVLPRLEVDFQAAANP